MLSNFPQIRDEESTYSIFSRLQFAWQPPNLEVMGTMLFNRKFEVGRLNFQGSFDYLCNNLPSAFTSENFLYSNTIFPLFIPFISKEKKEKALVYFKGNYPDKINKCLKISDITKTRAYIRVCKKCIKEDLNTFGEPYFRRQHEIELNRMCYKHKIPLYEYSIFPYKIPRRYDDYYTILKNSAELTVPEEFKKKFLDIAEDINTIFASNLDNWSIEVTKYKIFNKIAENGYVTTTGITLQQKFSKDLKEYYTEEFLDYIGYNFDINENDSWVRHTTTRKKTVSDPLKFILVIRYLFGSFKEFYNYNQQYSIFKQGPYPCLNIVCPHYKKLVIMNIMQINNSHGYPLATFKCDHCGFTYSRRGPDKTDNDIYIKTSVKNYGYLWHDKLRECVGKDLSLRKMSQILNFSNFSKLKVLADKYKNPNSAKHTTLESTNNLEFLSIEQYKNKILSFLKENPTAGKLDIYRLNPKLYKYLLENDNEWLIITIKPSKNNNNISKEEKLINYWPNKDGSISENILMAISKIKSQKTPHVRITIAIVQKYIGYYNLHQNRNKLHKCSQILDKECETILAYQKRRVNYVLKEMADNNVTITYNKVLRNAGINRTNQEVLNYIEKLLKEYNHGKLITIDNDDIK